MITLASNNGSIWSMTVPRAAAYKLLTFRSLLDACVRHAHWHEAILMPRKRANAVVSSFPSLFSLHLCLSVDDWAEIVNTSAGSTL